MSGPTREPEWRKNLKHYVLVDKDAACNHSHVAYESRRAYAQNLIHPHHSLRRLFWWICKTPQHYCRKCNESLRHFDKRYYR